MRRSLLTPHDRIFESFSSEEQEQDPHACETEPMQRRFSGSSLKEMFSDTASNDGATDYDDLFKDRDDGEEPAETRGPQVRYDPTLTAVQAYAEREYGYESNRGSVSAFDPDMMSRVEVAVDRDEMLDVVHAAHNRRRCIFCVALVVVVGSVVIGSSMGFSMRKKGGGGGVGVGTASSVLVAPPQALEQMCSIANIATEEGHSQCEGACQAAACCMAAGTKSCFLEQEGICGMYSPCGVLHSQTEGGTYSSYDYRGDGDVVVPPPPVDIESQCSDASLSTINGYIACQSACHPGKCCYAGAPHDGSDIPFSSNPGSYAVESCVQSHRDVCLGYAPCLSLDGTGQDTPQQTVERKCTVEKVKSREGREACDDLCKARSCCFASSEKRNCRIDNKKWCAEYQACEVLLDKPPVEPHKGQFGDVDAIDSNQIAGIASQCDASSIVTHADLLACEDACRPALCCFYDDVECEGDFARQHCNDFFFCQPIVAKMFDFGGAGAINLDNDDLGPPSDDAGGGGDSAGGAGSFEPSDALGSAVAEACDLENLKTAAGRDDCRVLCEPYTCCADLGPNGCSSNRECPRYEKCGNLVFAGEVAQAEAESEVKAEEGGIVPPDPNEMKGDSRPVGYDPETYDMALACSEDFLDISSDRCQFLCDGMMCCFDYSDNGCYTNPDCVRFKSCGALTEAIGYGGIDSEAANTLAIEEACDPSTIDNPKKEDACYKLCSSHKCCFDGSCPQKENRCIEYDACDILFNTISQNGGDYDDSVGMPEPPADLKPSCNPFTIDQGDNRYDCEEICLMANCCRGVGFDCRDKVYFCDKFILCETVWDDDGSPDYFKRHNEQQQQQGVTSGGGSPPAPEQPQPQPQPEPQPEIQNPIVPPQEESVPATSAPPPPPPTAATGGNAGGSDDPKVLCSIENLELPGGEEACNKVCMEWKCCWGDNSKGEANCFDENTMTCLRYLDCPTN